MHVTVKDEKWPKTMFDDDEPRQPGLHLSDIISSLAIESGIEKPRRDGEGFRDMELTAEIGLLWERILSKVMGEKYALRPPQIAVDGIWMSPDGIAPDPEDRAPLVVEEYKATWKSTKQLPTDNWKYMTQVKSYCRALDTHVCIMRIFHLMGDYKGSGPIYRVARLEFSPGELESNWQMILKHREKMEAGK